MRHLSICFLLSWFFVCTCLFCVIRFGSGIDWGERCISDLLFLANRHVVVSYWLRLLTRFNATSIRICITALEYKTIHSSSSSMFQIFYRSAMRLIVHPKCWPRAIRLAKVAFFVDARISKWGWDRSNYRPHSIISHTQWTLYSKSPEGFLYYCMVFSKQIIHCFNPPSRFQGWSHFMVKRSG